MGEQKIAEVRVTGDKLTITPGAQYVMAELVKTEAEEEYEGPITVKPIEITQADIEKKQMRFAIYRACPTIKFRFHFTDGE